MRFELTGDTWTHYLWFCSKLMGVVRSEQVSYLHSEHLGRPEFATNGSQQSVRKAYNYAYGRSVTQDSIGGLTSGSPVNAMARKVACGITDSESMTRVLRVFTK